VKVPGIRNDVHIWAVLCGATAHHWLLCLTTLPLAHRGKQGMKGKNSNPRAFQIMSQWQIFKKQYLLSYLNQV
jgi:hypothetical protein